MRIKITLSQGSRAHQNGCSLRLMYLPIESIGNQEKKIKSEVQSGSQKFIDTMTIKRGR